MIENILNKYDFDNNFKKNQYSTANDGIISLLLQNNNKLNTFDEKLNFLKDNFDNKNEPTAINKYFEKPRLDDTDIENFKSKLEDLEEEDLENFILVTIGDDEDKKLRLLNHLFPDIVKKRMLPAQIKLLIHNKIAKIIARGIKTREEFILQFLISSGKLHYDQYLLKVLLTAMGRNDLEMYEFDQRPLDRTVDRSEDREFNSAKGRKRYFNPNNNIDIMNDLYKEGTKRRTARSFRNNNNFNIDFNSPRESFSVNFFKSL